MRIISGKFKGKKLFIPKDKKTRPLKDITKESIFNLIIHSKKINFDFSNTYILDLFAGSGSFGLECLSRGSGHVTFVEKEKSLYRNILKNISHLGYENSIQASCSDAFKWMQTNHKKFDFIFLDPPFDLVDYKNLIRTIYQNNMINKGGKVFIETSKHTELELSNTQDILKDKIIGDVRLIILQ